MDVNIIILNGNTTPVDGARVEKMDTQRKLSPVERESGAEEVEEVERVKEARKDEAVEGKARVKVKARKEKVAKQITQTSRGITAYAIRKIRIIILTAYPRAANVDLFAVTMFGTDSEVTNSARILINQDLPRKREVRLRIRTSCLGATGSFRSGNA